MKTTFLKKYLSVLAVIGIFFSCGQSNESTSGGAQDRIPQTLLPVFSLYDAQNTKWKGACEKARNDNLSREIQYSFKESSLQKIEIVYDGLNCLPGDRRIEFVENWVNVSRDEQERLKGWISFYSQLQSITATPIAESIVLRYNQQATYEHNNWNVGEPREISGKKYSSDHEAEPFAGVVKAKTLKIEGNKLFFARYVSGAPQENLNNFFERF
ncbi:MAG: hypothetical protein NT027_01760 [Proteobacteria bacterium]|nr:hypothetical protein [Pseudomonadota bacterium]